MIFSIILFNKPYGKVREYLSATIPVCSDTMTYEEFASDLPRENKVSFYSIEENQGFIDRFNVIQEMKQLGKGAYRADLSERITKQVALYADRFNKGLSAYLAPPEESIGFLIPRTEKGHFTSSGSTISNHCCPVNFHRSES